VKKNKELATLREQRKGHDEEVESARAQQAKARSRVMQKEKNIKKADKALEGKVF
jgi:structural maintenance of chromosome 1